MSTLTKHELVFYPSEVLITPCETVTEFGSELADLVDEMWHVMYANNGVGLAANQIGVSKRIAVIDVERRPRRKSQIVLVNPYICVSHGNYESSEGCLSVPDTRETKRRNVTVLASAQDIAGAPFTIEGTWLLARAIQHECDHLAGRLCLSQSVLDNFLKVRAIADPREQLDDQEMRTVNTQIDHWVTESRLGSNRP